ncbi:hypothetical protein AB5I41_28790 [Sphingomonas sp. MMS24-JH45]
MGQAMNRERRLVALEQRKKVRGAVTIPMIAARLGEDSKDAVARYVAKHGPLPVVDEGAVNVIVMVPVEPKPRAA